MPDDPSKASQTLLVIIVILVGLIFSALVLTPEFGFSDDYTFLWAPMRDESLRQVTASGRPFTAFLVGEVLRFCGSIAELRILRALSLLISFYLGFELSRLTCKKLGKEWSIIFLLGVLCLPPFLLFYFWSTIFIVPVALLLGLLSGEALDRSWPLAVILLLLSFATYQPGAGLFFFPLLLNSSPRRAVAFASVFLATAALYFAWFRLNIWPFTEIAFDRSHISVDPVGKLRWFVESPLWESFKLFFIDSPWIVSLCVLAVLVWRLYRRPLESVILAGAMLLAYLPGIASQVDQSPIRTLGVLEIFIWLAICETLSEVPVPFAVAGVSLVAVAICQFRFLWRESVQPQARELQCARWALTQSQGKDLVVVQPDLSASQVPVYYDEFGLSSTFQPWTIEPLFKLLAEEQGRTIRKITHLPHNESNSPPSPVEGERIDMQELLTKSCPL